MITLYENAFSPFARKVRIVLEHKRLEHRTVDGLRRSNRDELERVNGRVEVPALDHDGLVVVGSSDIVAYLERVAPERPVYPAETAEWVRARAWERCADAVVDAILTGLSVWVWAERDDAMPEGMREAARRDLDQVYAALERDLEGRDFVCGAVSIADMALFPHMTSTRTLGVGYDAARFPRVDAWQRRLRGMDVFRADLERTKRALADAASTGGGDLERRRIFWRGDRIEWLLARGFHRWLGGEIEAGRVIWPGLGVPAPRARR
ncbi:MAG: glutathione S-transferase family protein [Polyangiaceae bacterium]|nr:glutathione S-transferase family protein [Polyangiaceae bacterium]